MNGVSSCPFTLAGSRRVGDADFLIVPAGLRGRHWGAFGRWVSLAVKRVSLVNLLVMSARSSVLTRSFWSAAKSELLNRSPIGEVSEVDKIVEGSSGIISLLLDEIAALRKKLAVLESWFLEIVEVNKLLVEGHFRHHLFFCRWVSSRFFFARG